MIHTDVDSVIASVTSAVRDLGLHAIKFSAGGYIVSDEPWDSGPYAPFWEAVSTLGVPVFFTLVTGPARAREAGPDPEGQRGYLSEQRILMRLMERYPQMLCSLTHGFPWRVYLDGDRIILARRDMEAVREPEPEPGGVLPCPHRRHLRLPLP